MGFFRTIGRGLTSPVRLVRDDVVNASHRVCDDVDWAKRAMFQITLSTRRAIDEMYEAARLDPDQAMEFEDAVGRWGIAPYESDLARARNANAVAAVAFLTICGWGVAYGADLVASGHIFSAIECALVAVVGLTTATASLWRWQVLSHRKYVSFSAWLKRGGSVLAVLAVAAVAWAVFFSSAPAVAQSVAQTGSIDLPAGVQIAKDTDLSAKLLRYLIGDTVFTAIAGSAGSSPMVNPTGNLLISVLQFLNCAALCYVSVWIMYMWGVFAIATAHEGKKIGGGVYNSLWVPARHAFSFALAAPVLYGLSLLQVAALATICLSINCANSIWDFATNYLAQNVLNPSNVTSISGNSLAAEARRMLPTFFLSATLQNLDSACGNGTDAEAQLWSSPPQVDGKNTTADNYSITQTSNTNMTFAARAPQWAAQSVMASVSYSYASGDSQSAGWQKQVAQARIQAAKTLFAGAQQLARSYLTAPYRASPGYCEGSPETPQTEDSLVSAYVQSVTQALQSVAQSYSTENMQDKINTALDINSSGNSGTNMGWAGAGLFSFAVSRLQQQLDDMLLGQITIKPLDMKALKRLSALNSVNLTTGGGDILTSYEVGWGDAQVTTMKNASVWYASNVDHHLSYSATAQADSGGSLAHLIEGVVGQLAMSDEMSDAAGGTSNVGLLASTLEAFAHKDPLVVLCAVGGRMMTAGTWLLAGGGGMSVLAAAVSSISSVFGGAANVLGSVTTALALTLIVGGVVLAYIAPCTMLLYWCRALVSWIYMVLEVLVACPFWSIVHAAPEGQGMAGNAGRKGYFLLANVFIYPMLLVFGIIASYSLLRGMGWFFYTVWSSYLSRNSDMSFTGNLIYSVMYVSFMYSLVILICTKGVVYLPDKIMKWISDALTNGLDGDELHSQPSKIVGVMMSQGTQMGNMAARQLGQSKMELAGGKGGGGKGPGPGGDGPSYISRAGGSGGGSAGALPAAGKAASQGAKAAQAAGMAGTVANAAAASEEAGQGQQDATQGAQAAQDAPNPAQAGGSPKGGVASQGAANPARGGGSAGSTGQAQTRGQAAGQPRSAPQGGGSGGSAVGTSESPEPVQSA
jgi:conjugal transfer/type IV secretion protein DotA/TraY